MKKENFDWRKEVQKLYLKNIDIINAEQSEENDIKIDKINKKMKEIMDRGYVEEMYQWACEESEKYENGDK